MVKFSLSLVGVADVVCSVSYASHHTCQYSGIVVGTERNVPVSVCGLAVNRCGEMVSFGLPGHLHRNGSLPSVSISIVNWMLGHS